MSPWQNFAPYSVKPHQTKLFYHGTGRITSYLTESWDSHNDRILGWVIYLNPIGRGFSKRMTSTSGFSTSFSNPRSISFSSVQNTWLAVILHKTRVCQKFRNDARLRIFCSSPFAKKYHNDFENRGSCKTTISRNQNTSFPIKICWLNVVKYLYFSF